MALYITANKAGFEEARASCTTEGSEEDWDGLHILLGKMAAEQETEEYSNFKPRTTRATIPETIYQGYKPVKTEDTTPFSNRPYYWLYDMAFSLRFGNNMGFYSDGSADKGEGGAGVYNGYTDTNTAFKITSGPADSGRTELAALREVFKIAGAEREERPEVDIFSICPTNGSAKSNPL